MADAYARLTGHVGVCAVSSGVAHSNALTGVANAFFDGAPLLLISGASKGYGADRGVFQEVDQVALATPICKYAKLVNHVGDLEFRVKQAFAVAISGRPGPVHLTIPLDVMESEANFSSESKNKTSKNSMEYVDLGSLNEASQIIACSQHPLIIAGSGVFYSKGQEAMIRFSEAFEIPIVIPIWDRGSVDKPNKNFLGVIGAASGEARLLEDVDLFILAGVRVDYRTGFLAPPKVKENAFIIRIDQDPYELSQGKKPNLSFLANPSLIFDQLTNTTSPKDRTLHTQWLKEAQRRWRIFYSCWTKKSIPTSKLISGWHIVKSIQPLLTEDTVFLIDGGNIGQWAHMLLATNRYPSHWLTCGASGVVGWGIPGAMAAKLAYPDNSVLLLSGDGSFGFTITEIESAVRQKLPFVVVVANDSAWGIVACYQKRMFGQEGVIASKFGDLRFDKIAEALGANGLRIEDPLKLTSAIREGFSADLPTVIDVPISLGGPSDAK